MYNEDERECYAEGRYSMSKGAYVTSFSVNRPSI